MSYPLRDLAEIRRDVLEAMAERGISARQIMRETGISSNTVTKFLRGEGTAWPQTVVKLCRYLSLDWYRKEEELPA